MSIHGYQSYNPQERTKNIIQAAKHVLITYEAWNSALTIRQVFYRLVQEFSYGKTEANYSALVNFIARSRRAYYRKFLDLVFSGEAGDDARTEAIDTEGLIPFSWIRDEKGKSVEVDSYEDRDDFLDYTRRAAERMKLDRQEGQPRVIELWCEAASMVPLMTEIADPYGIRVSSGGGYDSVTAKHKLAMRSVSEFIKSRRGITVLHIGDFDPSGEGMFETLTDDVGEMAWDASGGHDIMEFVRIALREDQVIDMEIETAPPKPADSRRRNFVANHPVIRDHLGSDDITAQLEALTPPDLRELIEGAIEDRLDEDAYHGVLDREREIRAELKKRLS